MWEREATEWTRQNKRRVDIKRLQRDMALWERGVAEATPIFTQCRHLIKKFGGIVPFSVACQHPPQHVIKYWLSSEIKIKKYNQNGYDKTAGLVPTASLALLVQRARLFGIVLTADDIYPDLVQNDIAKVEVEDKERWRRHLHSKMMNAKRWEHKLATAASASIPALTGGSR